MAPYATLAEWSSWGWPMLANHLWQATLFSLLAFTAAALLRRAPASARYYVWFIALIKFALPSALLIFLISEAGVDVPALTPQVGRHANGASAVPPLLSPLATPPIVLRAAEPAAHGVEPTAITYAVATQGAAGSVYTVLTFVWLAGVLILLLSWCRQRRRVSAALSGGRQLSTGREADALRRVQAWLGYHRKIGLAATPAVSEPAVWGVLNPLVVLPEGIAEQMDDGELEAVLMHEVTHVERRDNLAGNFQRLLCCLFWFHPLVWLIDRRLLSEREQACDDTVVRLSGASDVYASGIAKVCRHCVGWQVAGLSGVAGSDLKRRMERILSQSAGGKLSAVHLIVVAFTAALGITLTIAAGQFTNVETATQRQNAPGTAAVGTPDPRFDIGYSPRPTAQAGAGARTPEVNSGQQARAAAPGVTGPIQMPPETVEVSGQAQQVEASPTTIETELIQPRVMLPPSPQEPPAEPGDVIQAAVVKAASVEYGGLRRFIGRYEVDPGRAENFVLDVTLEGGELWLKPSHSEKRRLIRQSETKFADSYGQYRFTSILDGRDQVVGLRLDSWGRNVTARKLSLPPPSLAGNTTFRLRGYAGARVVAVAGTFNDWNQSQLLFAREGNEWVCRVNLPPGTYQYKFIVDGDWLTDPNNPVTVHDERGFLNSLMKAE